MYINLNKIVGYIGIGVALVIIAFGVYKFIVAININQQIASTLVAIFGLQLGWLTLWVNQRGKTQK